MAAASLEPPHPPVNMQKTAYQPPDPARSHRWEPRDRSRVAFPRKLKYCVPKIHSSSRKLRSLGQNPPHAVTFVAAHPLDSQSGRRVQSSEWFSPFAEQRLYTPNDEGIFMDRSSSTSAQSQAQAAAPQFAVDVHTYEPATLQRQIAQSDFTGLRQYLARTRQSRDWQDRYFLLDVVAPAIVPRSLDALCAAEPNASDLCLIRAAHSFDLSSKSRGTKTADRTTDQQFTDAQQHAKEAIASARRAAQLDPADPTPHVFAMRAFQVFAEFHKFVQQAHQQATRVAPDFVPAHFALVNAQSKKWGGSHEESLRVARHAMSTSQPGSDAAACLFLANLLVWQYATVFDKDKNRAKAYITDAAVCQELNAAFDRWTTSPYQSRRSSVPYLHHAAYWYYQAGDRVRLQRALALTANKPWEKAWVFAGDGPKTYAAALEFAAGNGSAPSAKKGGLLGWFKS